MAVLKRAVAGITSPPKTPVGVRTRPMQPAATTTNSSSLPSLTRGSRSRLLRLDAPAVRASPLPSPSSIAPLHTSCRRQSCRHQSLLSAARSRPMPVQPATTTTTNCSLSRLTRGTRSGPSPLSRSRCSSATRTTCLGAETYRSIAYYDKGLEILMATLGERDPPSQRPAGAGAILRDVQAIGASLRSCVVHINWLWDM